MSPLKYEVTLALRDLEGRIVDIVVVGWLPRRLDGRDLFRAIRQAKAEFGPDAGVRCQG